MINKILKDNKNYEVKILCEALTSNGDLIIAGENGAIKINNNYLNPFTNTLGFLTDIIAIDITKNVDIIVLGADNDIGIYFEKENYKLYKVKHNINEDSLYSIKSLDQNSLLTWGESNKKYKLTLV